MNRQGLYVPEKEYFGGKIFFLHYSIKLIGILLFRGMVSRARPGFLAIFGQYPIAIISTLNFGQRNLVGPSTPPKNDPQ